MVALATLHNASAQQVALWGGVYPSPTYPLIRSAAADGISFDSADPDRCCALSPAAFAQQELAAHLEGNEYALAMLDFAKAEYKLMYDVLYLDSEAGTLERWDGEMLAICVPYTNGFTGDVGYRCYAAQEPIKFAVLFVYLEE